MPDLTRDRLLMAVISGRGSAYLRGMDLSTLDLSGAGWLTEADLRQANLANTNLSRANLKDSKLSQANLHAANLAGANLEGADLSKAKLTGANLRMANMRNANLQGARMVGAHMVKASLEGANLEGADMEGANLEGADLGKAKLTLANLKMATLTGANLQAANLFGTILDEDKNITRVPPPSHGFAGLINYVQLTDLIQLVCLSRSNVLIRLESDQGHGAIYVRSGRVYHAQTGTIKGEPAFLEMLHWKNGRFETLPFLVEGAATIDKPLEHLLIESMRQHDELESPAEIEGSVNMVREIKKHLPVPAHPSKELKEFIAKEANKDISLDLELQINDAFTSEDTGTILCSVVADEEVFIAPLSYLKLKRDHPLTERILAFQKASEGTGKVS